MENPFEILSKQLDRIESLLNEINSKPKDIAPITEKPISIKKAAALLEVSTSSIYQKVSNREIPVNKKGNKLYFFESELIAWIKDGKQNTESEIRNSI